MINFVLLSNSLIKKKAFFESYFGTVTSCLKCVNIPTDTLQPISEAHGYTVACQRIKNYIEQHNDNNNIIITIENFLTNINDVWFEDYIVMIAWKDIKIYKVSNKLVWLDSKYVDILFANSSPVQLGRNKTISSVMSEINNSTSDDWYKHFNDSDQIANIKNILNSIMTDEMVNKLPINQIQHFHNVNNKYL